MRERERERAWIFGRSRGVHRRSVGRSVGSEDPRRPHPRSSRAHFPLHPSILVSAFAASFPKRPPEAHWPRSSADDDDPKREREKKRGMQRKMGKKLKLKKRKKKQKKRLASLHFFPFSLYTVYTGCALLCCSGIPSSRRGFLVSCCCILVLHQREAAWMAHTHTHTHSTKRPRWKQPVLSTTCMEKAPSVNVKPTHCCSTLFCFAYPATSR